MSTPWWIWLLLAVELIAVATWLWHDEGKRWRQRRRIKQQAISVQISGPQPTRPDPGVTEYRSRRPPPPPPIQYDPDLVEEFEQPSFWPSRRKKAERRRARLEAEIAKLECELGIACDQDPCRHWLEMERIT